MGSDPQSMLNLDDQNCKCYAGRERPGLLKKISDLEAFKNKITKVFVGSHDSIEPEKPDQQGVLVTDDLMLAWIGELAIKPKLPTLGIDDFSDLVADIVCSSAHYFAGLFQSFANVYEITDGQYEDMKDATHAIARLVARELGFPLVGMDKTHMHEIEKDMADFNTPVCPNNCELITTCKTKSKYHHIKNKEECVVWHVNKSKK